MLIPRSLPITVTCGCGASGALSAGAADSAAWACPACGTRYATSGLDTADLARRLAAVKRYVWGGAATILLIAVVLALVRPVALLTVPVLLGVYYFYVMPRYRRKLRELYASLPEWQLRAQ
jgi:hypothetical protein